MDIYIHGVGVVQPWGGVACKQMKSSMNLTLPWPIPGLSPNDRTHWRKLAKLKKQYREVCAWTAASQGAHPIKAERLRVHLVFVPPNRRRRDDDNLVSAFKAGRDGLADVLCVDDSKWIVSHDVATGETGGFVRVTVEVPA